MTKIMNKTPFQVLCTRSHVNIRSKEESRNGWMICDFTSFSTVFQSYQDDRRMIMKGCVQWKPFTVEKISPRAGIESGPLDQ